MIQGLKSLWRGIKYNYWDGPRIKRNWVILMAIGIGTEGSILTIDHYTTTLPEKKPNAVLEVWKQDPRPQVEELPVADYSLRDLIDIIEAPRHVDHLRAASDEAIRRIGNLDEILIGQDGSIYTLTDDKIGKEDLMQFSDHPVICNRNSPIYKRLAELSGPNRELIERNVNRIVMITSRYISMDGSFDGFAGMVGNNGTVYLNFYTATEADLPHLLAHEANHIECNSHPDSMPQEYALQEPECDGVQLTTIKHLLSGDISSDERKSVAGWQESIEGRLKTIAYLRQFPDFETYSTDRSWISARRLLDAEVDAKTLRKYLTIDTGDEKYDAQLRYAAQAAYIALTMSLEEADKTLLDMAGSEHDFARVSAKEALQYLHPSVSIEQEKGLPTIETLQGDYKRMYRASQINYLFGNTWGDGFRIVLPISADYRHTDRDSTIRPLSLEPTDRVQN